jgi:hypothetical protein
MHANRHPMRREALIECGATEAVLGELLAYTDNPFDHGRLGPHALPLADEPHLEAWEAYAAEARALGVFPALARRLVQLRFPIEQGISQTEAYRAATRRGVFPAGDRPGFELAAPDHLELVLHPTLAGRLPILIAGCRADFVALVRACSARNEPERVPASMGACIVTGLNNWDRVARHRRRLEDQRGAPLAEADWAAAFRDLVPEKALYQDRFIILSRDPYSAVPAVDAGMDDAQWRDRSVVVRREHESTHYFTLRAFGVMRNNLLDEFIADFAGLVRAFGRYESGLALRFLGLEAYPAYRPGGRFENYLDAPPISAAAAEVLKRVVVRAARNVDRVASNFDLRSPEACARMVVALARLSLDDLAARDGGTALDAQWASITSPWLDGTGAIG